MDNALLRRIYLAGSDDLRTFGGLYQGAYCLQQVPEEAAEFITLCRERGRPNPRLLEVGSAAGGFSKLLDDELVCRSVSVIDDNRHPNAIWRPTRLPHAREYIGNSTEAGPWLAAQGERYDLALIDTDHTYATERRNVDVVLPYIEAGGLLAFHDSIAASGDNQVGQLLREMKDGLYPDVEHLADIGSRLGLAVFRKRGDPPAVPYVRPQATLLYHFCPWLGRPEMVEFHLKQLSHYLPQFTKVRINIVTGDEFTPVEQIEERLREHTATDDVQFFTGPNLPSRHGEVVPFFDDLLPSVEPDENVCYGHTKAAMVSGQPGGRAWAELMYAHTMQNTRAAAALLKTNACVGNFKRDKLHRGARWHYAGTFFWFRNVQRWPNYTKHCTSHRFAVEQWLGSFVPSEQAINLHNWSFLRGFVHNHGGLLARYCTLPE
jgi:hypothetical protein